MINSAVKNNSTKVTNTTETNSKRHLLHAYKKVKPVQESTEEQIDSWHGQERRSGKDRREKDMISNSRLDSRNKSDRRAAKLSIQV